MARSPDDVKDGQTAQDAALLAQILQTALTSATEQLNLSAAAIVGGVATVMMRVGIAAINVSAPAQATHNRNTILAGVARVSAAIAATHVKGEQKETVN